MTTPRDLMAYVDFFHPMPLAELATLLSRSLFADLRFTGLDEGIWDEVPAVRLERDFMGLRVELGGEPGEAGGFTLQVEPVSLPEGDVAGTHSGEPVADLSWYLGFLLKSVKGVRLRRSPDVSADSGKEDLFVVSEDKKS